MPELIYGRKNLDWSASAEALAEYLATQAADELTAHAERGARNAGRSFVMPTDVARAHGQITARVAEILGILPAPATNHATPAKKRNRKSK